MGFYVFEREVFLSCLSHSVELKKIEAYTLKFNNGIIKCSMDCPKKELLCLPPTIMNIE